MIQVQQLVKHFGRHPAVRGVTFEVQTGEVLGFLGPNGAGKTTTMRMITGYLPPTSGMVTVGGVDVRADPVGAQKQIGYLPENVPLYGEMTVELFLRFIADIRGFRGRERERRVGNVLEKCFLEPVRRQPIETLSKGYRQRTGFAQAILHDPPVLILDEPTEGLDPNQKHVVRSMIRHMGREKVIILSTHILEEVEAICSRVLIISNGLLAADSTPSELRRRSELYRAVQVDLPAGTDSPEDLFRSLPDVARVENLPAEQDRLRLRLYPKNQRPLVEPVLAAARSRGLPLLDVRTEEGRLDDVFRRLTTTEDAAASAQEKE